MALDLAEISGLADPARHVNRCTESSLIYLEVLIMGMCGVIPWIVQVSQNGPLYHECDYDLSDTPDCQERERIIREIYLYLELTWILPVCLV